jgi:hypothetical protein
VPLQYSQRVATLFDPELFNSLTRVDVPGGKSIGGEHGIGPVDWKATEKITDMTLSGGSIHLIPRSDSTAIEAEEYGGREGDMNKQWGTNDQLAMTAIYDPLWQCVAVRSHRSSYSPLRLPNRRYNRSSRERPEPDGYVVYSAVLRLVYPMLTR